MSRTETYNKLAEKLLSHVENNTTDQVEGTLSVPTSAYTDPQRPRQLGTDLPYSD